MKRASMVAAATLVGALALPGVAAAQEAFVTTDLNMRMGPGPEFEVVTVIPADEAVILHGCTETMSWCQVSWGPETGWAFAAYLAYEAQGTPVIVSEIGAEADIPIIGFDATATGAVGGATVGAIVGGPVGAVVGGIAGATIGTVTAPPPVRTYVVQQPVEPVLLEGEVVIGAELPEVVVLHPIPDYEYRFAYVNHQRVLVEPGTRRVVSIIR